PKQQEITGKVTNEVGNPLQGVTVTLKGTTTATTTDAAGVYHISINQPDAVLVFTTIGHETQELSIGETTVVDIVMRELVSDLDEVVVIGYGTQRRSEITGAIASV